MTRIYGVISGALLLAISASAGAAQSADQWWEWALPAVLGEQSLRTSGGDIFSPRESRRERDDDRRDARQRRQGDERWDAADRRRDRNARARGNQRRGNGPPFCRNGAGHPVHGPRWCAERGWGSGLGGILWERARWEDVILRQPRRRSGVLDRGTLADVLGDVVFGRLAARSGSALLSGRWIPRGSGAVLQVRAGGAPLAELSDVDGDGRVDAVLLAR